VHLELDNVVLVPKYTLPPSPLHVLFRFFEPASLEFSVAVRDILNLYFDTALLVRPHAFVRDGCGAVTSGIDPGRLTEYNGRRLFLGRSTMA
jgi:hypothetical protein